MKRENLTSASLVNVKDIEDIYTFTKDGQIEMIANLGKINIDLLSQTEKSEKAQLLANEYKSIRNPFDIISIPRSVNMEKHIEELNRMYNSELNQKKRMVLSILMKQDRDIMMSGTNYEHQFYFCSYEPITAGIEKAQMKLRQRMNEYKKIFSKFNMEFEILSKPELIKLYNLFANGEVALMYKYDEKSQQLPYSMIM